MDPAERFVWKRGDVVITKPAEKEPRLAAVKPRLRRKPGGRLGR